ncbi:T9SS type A sorting domain-containing protein [Winogradskyella sp.]|uniref:beta strand repeat-containing protein n=1 Tax=Winogradskyella sp. TaxID=1883156 RepID=UPI0025F9F020|nr:T9SS type A sorting domain-containing protein [Winogradskyella sp.]
MKHFYTFLITLLVSGFGFGQTNPGDIAFTAFNADGTDEFAFVTLVDISANTTIWFTDNEWGGNSFNDLNEGEIQWSHSSIVPAGTVILIENTNNSSPTVNIGTVSGGSVNLNASDEELFALLSQPSSSTMATPGFLAGIASDLGSSTLTGTNLTLGTNFIDFNDDNDGYEYTGPISGESSFANYLPLIMDTGVNWFNAGSSGNNILPISTTVFTIASGCTSPTTQASIYNTTSIGNTTATLNWTSGDGNGVLVVMREGSAVNTDPTDGTTYISNTIFTSGDQIGTGNYVVQSGSVASSVSITGLNPSTIYHVAIYEYNTTGTCYELTELTGDFTTDCSTPSDVSAFTATSGDTSVDLSWTNGSCFDEILVVAKAGSTLTNSPTGDGTAYTADASFSFGTDIGSNEYVVFKGSGTSITVTGLTNGTTYHFEVFARKATTWSSGVTNSSTPNAVEEPLAGDLIITEVSGDNSDGSNNDNGYMEIYNRSNKIINLDNIEARYFNSNPGNSTQQVTLSGTLSPDSYIIVTQNASNYTTEFTDTADAIGSNFFFNGSDDGCDVFHTSNGIIDQFNHNGSGQSPWTWNDNFSYKRNSSDGGEIEENWTADGTNNNPRTKPNLYFWTGNSDSSWTTTGNWDESSAPSSTTDVVITDQTNQPSISTLVDVSHATIETSSALIIEKTGSLEIAGNLNNNGSLTLGSDSNEYSSLIVQGTAIGGTVQYNRYVNNNASVNGNDLISAPLSGQAFDTFITNNPNILTNTSGPEVLFGGFDNNNSSTNPFELWDETDATPLIAGKGYRSGISVGASSNLVTFEGAVNTGLVEIAISQGTESKLNLIGNPFPSYLDAQLFLTQNASLLDPSASVIYGYNDSTDGTSAGDYTIISALLNNTLDIAPGQAFFVASDAAPAGDVEFTTNGPDMRLAAGGDDFIAGRNTSAITNLKLNLSTATDNFITDIFFTESSSLGLDPGYDASLLGGTAPTFALYSHLVQDNADVPMAVQALGETDYSDVTIPLGVNANQGEQLTFNITANTLPNTVEVYLDDTIESTTTLLNSSDYILTPNANLIGTGRFFLRFMKDALSTPENNFDSLNIFTNKADKTIVIAGQLLEATKANIYDLQGRIVGVTSLDTSKRSQSIDVSNLSTGVYIVQLSNAMQTKSQKVIIR